MLIEDYEKVTIGLLISEILPSIDQRSICFELEFDRFKIPSHRLIYKAIQQLVGQNKVSDIASIIFQLGENGGKVGGEAYLRSLWNYPRQMKSSNLVTAARVVDVAGKLRLLDGLLTDYRKQYEDFESLVMSVGEEVDKYVYQLYHKIENILTSNVKTTAVHTSELKGEELEILDLAGEGRLVDVLPFGWPTFEENFIPRPSSMGVISGIASRGKTSLGLQMAVGVAMMLEVTEQKGHTVVTELDTSVQKLYRRTVCMLASVDSKKLLRGELTPQEKKGYMAVMDYLDSLPIFFDQSHTVEEVKLQAATLGLLMGPRKLGIWDYAELFQFSSGKGMSETERVTNVGLAVKQMARELGSCEILVSQFNNTVLTNPHLIGGPYATRNSGALFHQCDWNIEIYNIPEMLNKADEFVLPTWATEYYAYAIVHKNKDTETTRIPLTWEAQYTRFKDIVLSGSQLYDF